MKNYEGGGKITKGKKKVLKKEGRIRTKRRGIRKLRRINQKMIGEKLEEGERRIKKGRTRK